MPELVKESVAVEKLREGDTIEANGIVTNLTDVSVKTKYVYLSDTTGVSPWEKGTEVIRCKYVPTAEERAAKERERAVEYLTDEMSKSRHYMENARRKMQERINSEYEVDWRVLSNFMESQARHRCWAIVERVMEQTEKDIYTVTQLVGATFLEEIMRASESLTNRSTAKWANICDDVVTQAKAKWIEDLRWRAGIRIVPKSYDI